MSFVRVSLNKPQKVRESFRGKKNWLVIWLSFRLFSFLVGRNPTAFLSLIFLGYPCGNADKRMVVLINNEKKAQKKANDTFFSLILVVKKTWQRLKRGAQSKFIDKMWPVLRLIIYLQWFPISLFAHNSGRWSENIRFHYSLRLSLRREFLFFYCYERIRIAVVILRWKKRQWTTPGKRYLNFSTQKVPP